MNRIILDAGPLRAGLDPTLGACLTEFSLRGPCDDRYPLMRRAPGGRGDDTDPAECSSFLMGPWTNRIRDARFNFQGHSHTLRPNFPDGTAIHGVLRDAPWRITDRTPVSARLVYDSRTQEAPNFPFAFGSVFRVELTPEELILDLSITNLDDRPMPAGCGHHPYFPRTLMAAGEQVHFTAGVAGRYEAVNCLPTGPARDDAVCAALRAGGPLGDPNLDDVFSGLDHRPPQAIITWPDSRVRLTMDCSEAFNHLVVFTPRLREGGPPLPWFCVEPCTMPNDGFNLMHNGQTDTGVRVLAPGESLQTRVRFRVERL